MTLLTTLYIQTNLGHPQQDQCQHPLLGRYDQICPYIKYVFTKLTFLPSKRVELKWAGLIHGSTLYAYLLGALVGRGATSTNYNRSKWQDQQFCQSLLHTVTNVTACYTLLQERVTLLQRNSGQEHYVSRRSACVQVSRHQGHQMCKEQWEKTSPIIMILN